MNDTGAKPATIVDELRKLMRAEITDPAHDCTASEVAKAVCSLLGEIELKNTAECDKLCDWEQEIRELHCKIIGGHIWEHDMCCYWGHQFCSGCGKAKYPELARLSCSGARAKIGAIDESEYQPTNWQHI